MKTGIYGLLTLIFSGCAMMAGLNSKNVLIGYLVAGLAWAFFIRGYQKRTKKAAERKLHQQQFHLYLSRMQNQH